MRSGSAHLAVAKVLTWVLFSTNPRSLREGALAQIDEEAAPDADPDDHVLYARTVAGGWVALGFLSGLATVLLAFLGHAAGGGSGRTAGLAAGLGAVFFCVAGALYASWKMLRAYGLRGAVRRHGIGSPQAERAEHRSALHNTSLIGQTIVAVIAILLASGG